MLLHQQWSCSTWLSAIAFLIHVWLHVASDVAAAEDIGDFHVTFSDPGIPPPSLILGFGQNSPPYTIDDTVMEPLASCGPTQASVCSVQNAIRQVAKAREIACPELEASVERRQAALEVLRQGNFSLAEFGSTGFDVFVFTPAGEVLADPLRPDLVGQNFASQNFSGPSKETTMLLDRIEWVVKWGGGFVSHPDIRLEGGDPVIVSTYIETCAGTGDRLAVSFKRARATFAPDCSREFNSICARHNVDAVFGLILVDMLTANTQIEMSDLWYRVSFSEDYRVDNFTATVHQQTWAGHPDTTTPAFPNNLGTVVASGTLPGCLGQNASECLGGEAAAGLVASLGYSTWRGHFLTNYDLNDQAGLVAGIVWNNTVYSLITTLRHQPQPSLDGPLCTTCTSNNSLVCALANAQSLVSHASVDLALPGHSWDRVTYDPWLGASHAQVYDGEKIWPEGFFLRAFADNGTCIGDGQNPSNVGKSAFEIFGNDDAHQSFMTAAMMNARWMPYEENGVGHIAYVNSVRSGGHQNYVMVSVSRAWAAWDAQGDCDVWASENCSNWRSQVSLGAAAGEVVACLDEDCLFEVIDKYDVGNGMPGYDGSIDFPVHLYDSDFGCWSEAQAHGIPCPPEFDAETKSNLKKAMGSSSFATVAVESIGLQFVAWVYYLEWRAVNSDERKAFHMITFTVRDVIEPMCTATSDCPAHSFCSIKTGRCECDSGYHTDLSLMASTCGGMEPTKMICVFVEGQDCTSSSSSTALDLSSCRDCRGGFFCADGIPASCPVGQYCPGNTSTTYPCPAGSISNSTELSECYACSPGTSSPMVGGQECIGCAAGTYAGRFGQTSCNLCATGFYSSSGQVACDECPDGTYTSGAGATSISECRFCRDGYYYDSGSCKQCPFGYDSINSGDTSCHMLTSIQVSVPSSVAFILLACWVFCIVRRQFRARVNALQKVADEVAEENLVKAKENIEEFGHPMVLVPVMTLLHMSLEQLGELHEGSRDAHRLIFIDSMDRCQELRASGSKIILLSYQLPFTSKTRCPSDAQFQALKSGLREALAHSHWDVFNTLVWMDILSLPQQAHIEMRKLATSSCYTYSKFCDVFLAVCPPIANEFSGEIVDLQSYQSSARARVQVLSFCCARGPQSVFIFDGRGLRRAPLDFLVGMTQVFEGERRCCQLGHGNGSLPCEAFGMMLPMLGLYADNAGGKRRKHRIPGVEFFDKFVKPHKDLIFPQLKKYEFQHEHSGKAIVQMRELFGDLITRAAFHCAFTSLFGHDAKGDEQHCVGFDDPAISNAHIATI